VNPLERALAQVFATLEIPWGRNLTSDVDIVVAR